MLVRAVTVRAITVRAITLKQRLPLSGLGASWSPRQQTSIAWLCVIGLLLLVLRQSAAPVPSRPVTATADHRLAFRIDINRAHWGELTVLPGISDVRARRLVAWRQQHGPFRSLEDLQKVRGIGPKLAARWAPWIHFGPPASPPPPVSRIPRHVSVGQ